MSVRAVALALTLASAGATAATPPEGVPFSVRRGFFTETDIGGFFTLGGDNAYSNFQTYLQLGIGLQLTVGDGVGLIPIGIHVGVGANAQNCWAGLASNGACTASDNFTLTFFTLSAGYLFRIAERLYLGPKVLGGGTLLDPQPVKGVTFAMNLGGAVTLEWATSLDHFSIGLDVSYRLVLGPNINALAIHPRVQYTF